MGHRRLRVFANICYLQNRIPKQHPGMLQGGSKTRMGGVIGGRGCRDCVEGPAPVDQVRHQVVNDLPLGRNIDEMLRMVDALDFHEEHGEVCPAGWTEGKAGMDASPAGVAKYLSEKSEEL